MTPTTIKSAAVAGAAAGAGSLLLPTSVQIIAAGIGALLAMSLAAFEPRGKRDVVTYGAWLMVKSANAVFAGIVISVAAALLDPAALQSALPERLSGALLWFMRWPEWMTASVGAFSAYMTGPAVLRRIKGELR